MKELPQKKLIIIAIFFTFILVNTVFALYCKDGKSLVTVGNHKHQVLSKCGPPVSKEIVGVDKKAGKYRKIAEWLYILNIYGHKQMYLLRFDGKGILIEIRYLGEHKE